MRISTGLFSLRDKVWIRWKVRVCGCPRGSNVHLLPIHVLRQLAPLLFRGDLVVHCNRSQHHFINEKHVGHLLSLHSVSCRRKTFQCTPMKVARSSFGVPSERPGYLQLPLQKHLTYTYHLWMFQAKNLEKHYPQSPISQTKWSHHNSNLAKWRLVRFHFVSEKFGPDHLWRNRLRCHEWRLPFILQKGSLIANCVVISASVLTNLQIV